MLSRQAASKNREERVKNIEKGLSYAKEAVQLDPHDGLSWAVLGNAHLSSFFGIQQNPKILKQCLSAYSQAEKDLVAKSTPDLHYNKGITLKYEEEYKLALESFNEASLFDPTWEPPTIKEKQLVKYLNDIQELVSTSGKMKPKRLQQTLQSIDSKQLGPYSGGSYTSSNGEAVKLIETKLSDLKPGINEERVILGKVVCSVRNEDTVPFTFCLVDKAGTCVVVTVFNLADGKGVIIGDSVAIPEPYLTNIDFSYKGNMDNLGASVDIKNEKL
ncbi:tetratricopeptide repeat protein 5-like [Anoplophora glabripennis]|uniref:tetratricopeptide repeat protein 5-like n=1 Tax=Anoplophora glabripennis TaxID=217634 RepID=UPI000C788761|nr:tetratricopeptide repeat protein 5-like [Anoplophora glabripennis]